MPQPIIRLEQVRKSFGRQVVLDGVSLDIDAGRTTVVIGPSGCGKTVLLKHIIGLERPDSGRVFFEDQEVSALSERRLVEVRRKMGFLFQNAALFDSMTVGENVMFPLVEHTIGTPQQQRDKCSQVLGLVGLDGFQNRYPEQLSGGQKKWVALARAIVMDPEVILFDEPTTGLDPIRADLINELILRLQKILGTTTVVVTHDMASARKVADRVVMLHEGRIIADTPPDKLGQQQNDVLARFVQGLASEEELAQLRQADAGREAASRPKEHE